VPVVALCLLAILLGAGCGQSGPLFLPAEETPAQVGSEVVDQPADGPAETDQTRTETKDREETH